MGTVVLRYSLGLNKQVGTKNTTLGNTIGPNVLLFNSQVENNEFYTFWNQNQEDFLNVRSSS